MSIFVYEDGGTRTCLVVICAFGWLVVVFLQNKKKKGFSAKSFAYFQLDLALPPWRRLTLNYLDYDCFWENEKATQ